MGLYRGRRRPGATTAAGAAYARGQRAARNARKAGMTVAVCGLLTAGGLSLPPSLAGYGLAAPAVADPATAMQGKTVTMDLAGADIHTVVNLLQRETRLNFAIKDGDKPYRPVTVGLDHAPFDKALRTIALSADAVVTLNEDGVYVFRPASAAPETSSGAEQAPPSTAASSASPAAPTAQNASPIALADLHWHKLVLQHAIPSEILKIMH